MKTDNPKKLAKELESVVELTGNAVGGTDMRFNRNQALKVLKTAQVIEAEKKKDFVWVTNGKTSVHTNPANVQKYLDDGFRVTRR